MFETDVGQNAPREYKAEIRKSESPLAAFAAFYQAEKALKEDA